MIVEALRSHPEIALFLCLAIGYVIGKVKVAGHALGLVTGSLFAGLFIGQLKIDISPAVKTVAFLLFLFGNGYSAGPQFMRALKQDGVRPLILTLVVTVTGLAAVYVMSRLLHLETGFTAGLLSGALTQSAAMGTATEAINTLAIPAAEKVRLANQVPVADAVCYLFGFWGEVLFVVVAGPKLLGINLQKEAKALEAKLGVRDEAAGASAHRGHLARAYRVESGEAVGRTIAQLEAWAGEQTARRIFALRVRRGDTIQSAALDTVLNRNDVVVLVGPAEPLVAFGPRIGVEVDDAALLDFPVEALDVVLSSRELDGMTVQEAAERWTESRSVFLRRLTREGLELPLLPGTRLNRGDVATLIGPEEAVEALTAQIGDPDRKTTTTDFFTVGLGIAVGCLIGLPAIMIGSVNLALSTSVGTLIAGLFFGWLRPTRPRLFGPVPEAAQKFMINFGLATFVAVTGLHAGPVFLSALREVGLVLFVAGVVCTLIPPTVGLLFGRYVLRMNPVLLLGAVAGAQTMTAAMVAVQEAAKSRVPLLGFTVPYAVANIILTLWGSVIVLLVS